MTCDFMLSVFVNSQATGMVVAFSVVHSREVNVCVCVYTHICVPQIYKEHCVSWFLQAQILL